MSLKWTVNELNRLRNAGLVFDELVPVNELKDMNKEIREVDPVHVQGRADFGSKKVTFHLHIEGSMILPCSRTLVDVRFPFTIQTNETFVLSPSEYEQEDIDFRHPEGEIVDLLPYVRESILVEIPMQIFSENQEKGAAPSSGEGWEVLTESQNKDRVDPRLEKLKDFFNKD